MTREEAVEIIKIERECVERNTSNECDRDCANCDLLRADEETFSAYDMAIEALQEPERKRGRWIKLSEPDENDNIRCRCSECHAEDVHSKSAIVPFCWKCGADMRGEQE